MEKRAFVLLSGGLDSTTTLYKAIHEYVPSEVPEDDLLQFLDEGPHEDLSRVDWVEAISVNYGQRHLKESEYARETCQQLGIKHSLLDLRGILSGQGVMLTDANVQVPDITYDEIKGVSPTYVPFRNGTLLSLITAHAQKWVNQQIREQADIYRQATGLAEISQACMDSATRDARDIAGVYFGAHAEDAFNWAYPDCTPEFIGAMANAIYVGSYYSIRLHTPFMWSSKADIVKAGWELGVPFENTWSCYKGEELQCGACPTCYARQQAFIKAGVKDPTIYARAVAA